MLADKIAWIGESSGTFNKNTGRWSRWALWPFKLIGDAYTYYMNEEAYHIYLKEKELLEFIGSFPISNILKNALIETIERYGDSREEKGREEVREDWAESKAGSGL